jgi:H+/gluconate symporter-like permease
MSEVSMSSKNSVIKTIIPILIVVLMFSSSLVIFLTPFTTRKWTVGSNTYEYETHFFGYWNFYNNTEIVSSGGSSTLDNFLIISPILIIVGLALSLILVPVLGSILSYDEKFQGNIRRILSMLVVLLGIIGFIGVMLQLPFFNYLDNLNNETKLSVGFSYSIIHFIVITLFGIILGILPIRNDRLNTQVTRSLE